MAGHVVKRRIVVVDPSPDSGALLRDQLIREGYTVEVVESAMGLRQLMADSVFDLVVLDIDLPDENGLIVVRELRAASAIGLIVLTSRSDPVDRIVALEMGADQYVIKPVEPRETAVRVRNLIWRLSPVEVIQPHSDKTLIRFDDWLFDVTKRVLRSADRGTSTLTRQEASVLLALVNNPGKVLSRDQLMDAVNREWTPTDRTVDVLIGRLRRKIEVDVNSPELIITIYGEGYLFAGTVL